MLARRGLIIVLIFISFGATACKSSRELHGGLTEQEAQRICVLLWQNGLDANKAKAGAEGEESWTVSVASPVLIGDDAYHLAQYILSESDLPRSRENPYLKMFKQDSLIPTQTEEELRKLAAKEEKMALSLESVSGVVSASVSLVLPSANPIVEPNKQTQASASVIMKYNSETPPYSPEEVAGLVAAGVEGLDANKVKVVMKAVKRPDPKQFDSAKDRFITYMGLAGITMILVLTTLLIYTFLKLRSQRNRITQLERSSSLRPVAKGQPATAAAR